MTDIESRHKAIETLSRLITDIPVAMITTEQPDRSLRSRPMVNINQRFEGDLWFFTHVNGQLVHEIQGNPQVNVAFSSPADHRYVSVAGPAKIVGDPKRIELLWTPDCQTWFPDGPNDEDLTLVRVDVERADYWDAKSNAMVAIAGYFRRLMGGEPRGSVAHESIEWSETNAR